MDIGAYEWTEVDTFDLSSSGPFGFKHSFIRKERLILPVWRKEFIERVNTVDMVCAKLLLLLCQESIAYIGKLWIQGTET